MHYNCKQLQTITQCWKTLHKSILKLLDSLEFTLITSDLLIIYQFEIIELSRLSISVLTYADIFYIPT